MFVIRYGLLLCICAHLSLAGGLDRGLPVADHPLVEGVLSQHYIPVDLAATVPVPFAVVTHLFEQDDILDLIQEEYARLLPPGDQPEFVVQQDGLNRWSYVNRNNQPSVITELFRDTARPGEAEAVFHTAGKRFFGDFEALTHVRLYEAGDASRYVVKVYAYPASRAVRFFARHLGLVRRYFEEKTMELSSLTAEIAGGIILRQDIATSQPDRAAATVSESGVAARR